jgi:uncharacterized protein (DUF58 family)
MHESIFPMAPKRAGSTDGVYADLAELVRLEYRARGFSFLPRQPVHSVLAGRHASRLRGRGLNFEEMRRYLPGDDVRNIDWRVTARTGKPHVRVYTEERDRPCLLLVDQRQDMFFGSRRCMKSVVAAQIAALAAWRVFGSGDRVGALIFDDHDIVEIAPERSRQNVARILNAIVEKNHQLKAGVADRNPAMLNWVLERAVRLARHDFLVCLIAGGGGANDETVRWATALARHNDVIACHVYDPMEAELPEGGRLVVSDGSLRMEVDSGDRRLRTKYREDFLERLEWMRHITRQRSTPLLPISTESDPVEQVRALLQTGGR